MNIKWYAVAKIFLLSVCGLVGLCAYWYWYGRFFTNKELEALDEVDQVKIVIVNEKAGGTPDEIRAIKIIDDPKKVERIVSKVRTYSDHWQYENFSPPSTGGLGRPAPVEISFYHREKLKTILSIGYASSFPYFIKRIQEGRYLEYQEFKEIMELLELDEKEAFYN